MNDLIHEKSKQLGEKLAEMGRVMVAFSGGVDSSVVLKRAKQELGDNVIAVVVASELFRQEEFDQAVTLAKEIGVPVYEANMNELDHPAIAQNNPDSWYYSKKMLYSVLNDLAKTLNFPYVLDGMIMDDLDDFRPGLRARTEANVRSVLQEVNMNKKDVRELAKHLALPVWDKPASCSLASRIPYGHDITLLKINQIDQAEKYIMSLGFPQIRVRHHVNTARIEVSPEQITALVEQRENIQQKLTSLGFTYVSIDLQGYRTGSMNEELPADFITKTLEKELI